MTTLLERRVQLEQRLRDLDGRLHQIEAELESHQTRDWDDLATEREGDEVLEGLGLSGQAEIQQIRAALQRIEAGEYGICTTCGTAISDARLDLLAFTPFCKSCAALAQGGRPAASFT